MHNTQNRLRTSLGIDLGQLPSYPQAYGLMGSYPFSARVNKLT